MYKILERTLQFQGRQSRFRWARPPPVNHNYRYSRQIIPGRGPNFRIYAQKPVVPRDRHSLTDIKDPFGDQFGRKAHLEGRQAVESVNNEWGVVFKLTYVHQIAGVGVAVWVG